MKWWIIIGLVVMLTGYALAGGVGIDLGLTPHPGAGAGGSPPTDDALLLEGGSDALLLEGGTDKLLLE